MCDVGRDAYACVHEDYDVPAHTALFELWSGLGQLDMRFTLVDHWAEKWGEAVASRGAFPRFLDLSESAPTRWQSTQEFGRKRRFCVAHAHSALRVRRNRIRFVRPFENWMKVESSANQPVQATAALPGVCCRCGNSLVTISFAGHARASVPDLLRWPE